MADGSKLSEAEVVGAIDASPFRRVFCKAQFEEWDAPQPGYVARAYGDVTTIYAFHYTDAKLGATRRQLFFPGFNPCTLYRL